MRQQLHLLIVNGLRRSALAARYGTRWLLPSIGCGEMARAGPLVARWCAERGIGTDVAGQWLGRVGVDTTDWLVAIPARDRDAPHRIGAEWIPLDALANGASILEYQTWALRRSLADGPLPSVRGPFGTLQWPETVRAWLSDTAKLHPCAWTPYRTSAHEAVLGIATSRGRVYFKGLIGDRASEADVTRRFAHIAPESFATTLATEHRGDDSTWWVTAECPGNRANNAVRVAAALGRLQQRLLPVVRESVTLEKADIGAALRFARIDDLSIDSAACEAWIPMDLDPTNVLIDGDRVTFIDLDDSFAGPAPLAMAGFALRCGADRAAAYRAYEQSWPLHQRSIDWRAFESAAIAFQSWRGWLRVSRNIERGELEADPDVLVDRIRARLARALQRG